MYEKAAKKKQELQGATIAETGRLMAKLEQETEDYLADLKTATDPTVYAQAITRQPPPPQVAPNATMIPVAPGNIIHSNNVNPDEMAIGMMQNPAWQQLGFSSEAGLLAVQLLLTQLNTKSLLIEAPAPSQPVDLQIVNGQAEAEARRKAEDEEEWTEDDLDEDENNLEESNREEGDKPVLHQQKRRTSETKRGWRENRR